MSPRQFPNHPTAKAVGAAALLSMFLFGTGFHPSTASGGPPEPPGTIAWRSEYNSAYFEAKDAKRLIWIQFTGPWCPNCRRMEHDSFPQPRIVERARDSFVPVKLRSDENEELALKFNLTGLPATVIIDPTNQTILSLRQGYLGPDDLDAIFADVISRRDRERKPSDAQLASATKLKAKEKNANLVKASTAGSQLVGPPLAARRESRLALSGYCPVSLVSTHKLVRGEMTHTVDHGGKLYRFASEALEQLFRKNPEKYVPVNEGLCPVEEVDREKVLTGDPRFGILYRDRLYLCATSADRGVFLKNPERYASAHIEEKGYCPHCTKQAGLLVKGDPRFGLIRSGREYWFPDADHRSAFLASLSAEQKTTRK